MATSRDKLLLPLLTFSLWMLASFFCHRLAKMALQIYVINDDTSSFQPLFFSLLVTLSQTLCCYTCVNVKTVQGRLFFIIALSHFLASLATNTSFALTYASSTMAVTMLEPITSAILQTVMFQTPMRVESLGGLVIVVVGAVLYVGNPAASGTVARAVGLAFISNLTLGVRNVAIKLSQNGNPSKNHFRSFTRIGVSSVAVMILLFGVYVTETAMSSGSSTSLRATYFSILSLASSVCHVTYSYVSTYLVLHYMSVVGHALANIFKRVLVVLLLHASGRRPGSMWNWSGLVLCTLGLLLYNRKKMMSSSALHSTVSATSCDASEEKGNTSSPSSSSLTRRKKKLLIFLLVLLLFAFSVCTMPRQMQTIYVSARASSEKVQLNLTTLEVARTKRTVLSPTSKRQYFSKIVSSHPTYGGKSGTDYCFNLRFGYQNWTDGKPLLSGPIQFQPEHKSSSEIEEFLSRKNLISTPFDTDGLSPYLTTAREIIEEAKRIHLNLFRDLFQGKKYAVLLELASHENKGDAAISVGEVELLETMGIELLFYVDVNSCLDKYYKYTLQLASQHPMDEVIVMLHGGGNIFGYPQADRCRSRALKFFRDYQIIFFPQSIYMRGSRFHFEFARKLYCCNPKLTILVRDRLSLQIARRLLNNGTRLVLAPDIALQIGHLTRFLPPYYDVIWQRRTDSEGPKYTRLPQSLFPSNMTVLVWDWLKMHSAYSNSSLVKAINIMQNGLAILQKGRVVVSDRLHGHLLSTVLDIPHVLVDNKEQKLSSYYNTWTRGLANSRLVDNPLEAASQALQLLHNFHHSLSPRIKAVHIQDKLP